MGKADYKAGFVLLGVLILMAGMSINYFSAEIVHMFLIIDIPTIGIVSKGIEQYSFLQIECAEIAIKVISALVDVGGILAIIYGFTSSKRKN